jgi:hypothetical protein
LLLIGARAGVPALAQARQTLPPRAFSELKSTVPSVSAPAAQELRILWIAYPGAAAPLVPPGRPSAGTQFRVLAQRPVPGTVPRERDPQLSVDQLVVVAVDTEGREVDWQAIADPRAVRAEAPGADGRLTGRVLHRAQTDFLLVLPVRPLSELRVYEPMWTGTDFILQPIGSVALGNPANRP